MRVIAGTSRGKRLVPFAGSSVRPTSDRVREALFSILHSKTGGFTGLAVLDLFAGSAALAIEALSRGAATAILAEKDPGAQMIITKNLEQCKLTSQAKLLKKDAWQALADMVPESFDLVFIDPPYAQGLAEKALHEVNRRRLLRSEGFVCVETGKDELLPASVGRLQLIDQRRYGSTVISFYSLG